MHLSSLGTLSEIKKTNITDKVSYFLLRSVGSDWRWAMRLWWWSAWQSIERDEYEREFFKCLGLLGGHYLDKLVTIFLHASCSSFSTCPGADYNQRKRDNYEKKQKGRYNIVEIDILLKRLEINNVIMIHDSWLE